MSSVDSMYIGTIFIKHYDRWRGDLYLKDNLTFISNKDQAGRFYILKQGDTTILNGDRISINIGNRTLIIDNNNIPRLIDRDQLGNEIKHPRIVYTFIVSNGSDNTDPITYDSPISFISDKDDISALKYESHIQPINSQNYNIKPTNILTSSPINRSHHDSNFETFQFILERSDIPIISSSITKSKTSSLKNKSSDVFDGYKGGIMIILLMVILVLCILINKY